MYGELTPQGGGDPIPLLKETLTIGRRESCDIVLRFGNVSGQHCQLSLENGYWFVQDNNSQNGTKVNGVRVVRKRLDPGDCWAFQSTSTRSSIRPRNWRVGPAAERRGRYHLGAGQVAAGKGRPARRPDTSTRRYDPTKDAPGQMKKGHLDD